eukprot:197424-Alexandrium_andersonii.AAC.1
MKHFGRQLPTPLYNSSARGSADYDGGNYSFQLPPLYNSSARGSGQYHGRTDNGFQLHGTEGCDNVYELVTTKKTAAAGILKLKRPFSGNLSQKSPGVVIHLD